MYSSDEDIIRSSQPHSSANLKLGSSENLFNKDRISSLSLKENFTSTPNENDSGKSVRFRFCANTLEIPGELDDFDDDEKDNESQEKVDIFASTQIIHDTPLKDQRDNCDLIAPTQIFQSTPMKPGQVDLHTSTQIIDANTSAVDPLAATQIINHLDTTNKSSENLLSVTLPIEKNSTDHINPFASTQIIPDHTHLKMAEEATLMKMESFAPTQIVENLEENSEKFKKSSFRQPVLFNSPIQKMNKRPIDVEDTLAPTQIISRNSPTIDNDAATQVMPRNSPAIDYDAATQIMPKNSPTIDYNAATQVISGNSSGSDETAQIVAETSFNHNADLDACTQVIPENLEDTVSVNDSRVDLFADSDLPDKDCNEIPIGFHLNDSATCMCDKDELDTKAQTGKFKKVHSRINHNDSCLEDTQIIERRLKSASNYQMDETQQTQLTQDAEKSKNINAMARTQIIEQTSSNQCEQPEKFDEFEETQLISFSDFEGSSPEIGGTRKAIRHERETGECLENSTCPGNTSVNSQQVNFDSDPELEEFMLTCDF